MASDQATPKNLETPAGVSHSWSGQYFPKAGTLRLANNIISFVTVNGEELFSYGVDDVQIDFPFTMGAGMRLRSGSEKWIVGFKGAWKTGMGSAAKGSLARRKWKHALSK